MSARLGHREVENAASVAAVGVLGFAHDFAGQGNRRASRAAKPQDFPAATGGEVHDLAFERRNFNTFDKRVPTRHRFDPTNNPLGRCSTFVPERNAESRANPADSGKLAAEQQSVATNRLISLSHVVAPTGEAA